MGTKDSKAKEYLSDNMRFSEICNYVLFDGEKVIKPEDLKECDTTEVLSVFGIDKKQIVKQKWRDLLKSVSVKHTGQMYVILIGAEAQTDIHYAMPVKTMIYDALEIIPIGIQFTACTNARIQLTNGSCSCISRIRKRRQSSFFLSFI